MLFAVECSVLQNIIFFNLVLDFEEGKGFDINKDLKVQVKYQINFRSAGSCYLTLWTPGTPGASQAHYRFYFSYQNSVQEF